MKGNIKLKLYIGFGLIAGFMIVLWISGLIFIHALAKNSGAIILENIRTITYAQQMEQALNQLYTVQIKAIGDSSSQQTIQQDSYLEALQQFENTLDLQENNITETGERELTSQIRANFRELLTSFQTELRGSEVTAEFIQRTATPAFLRIQQNLLQLNTMNVDAIHRKNQQAQQTATNVTIYMSVIGGICAVLGILMLLRFPGYIADPVRELDQAKTNFISIASHELKTPISSINMSLRLLEDERIGMLSEEQKKLTDNIRKDLIRMKRTTSELLDLSRIETGNIQLESVAVSPADLLEYACETMLIQATQKQIEMGIYSDESLPEVKADLQKTVWVLINLISNAIRFVDTNGTITLEARRDRNPGYVRFSVEDNGKGIDPDYLDKIFQKYFQMPKDQKDRSGSGLGLSIAKEFITAEGGKIWAESEPGKGSKFCFTLPVVKS